MKAPVKKIVPIRNSVAKTRRSPMLAMANDSEVGNMIIQKYTPRLNATTAKINDSIMAHNLPCESATTGRVGGMRLDLEGAGATSAGGR